MSIWLRRWRHKHSEAARRGREAHRQYTAWAAKQQALRNAAAQTATNLDHG
jgi:hypothetical protein